MTQKLVSIHAYDCLDNVNYSCRVREYKDREDYSGETVLTHEGNLRGEGIDDPKQWLMDVLIAIIETL